MLQVNNFQLSSCLFSPPKLKLIKYYFGPKCGSPRGAAYGFNCCSAGFFQKFELTQFRKLERNSCLGTRCYLRKTQQSEKVITQITLWMRFSLLTDVHRDQGKTLLRRLCVQWGVLIQISLESPQDFIEKRISINNGKEMTRQCEQYL